MSSKKKTPAKKKAPPVAAATACSLSSRTYAFVNNEGEVRHFDGKTTIPELLSMGVTKLGFVPIGSPPPEDRNVYVHSSENAEAMGGARAPVEYP